MKMSELKNSLGFKIIFTGILALTLLIPLGMVQDLIRERQQRRSDTLNEVSGKWGYQQNIAGPVLVVPYRRAVIEDVNGQKVRSIVVENAYFLPETMHVRGKIQPEKRSRGLYEVVLYSLKDLTFTGQFRRPDFGKLSIGPEQVLWDQAYVAVGIPDTRGIQRGVKMRWNGREMSFLPGIKNNGLFPSGIHVPVADIKGNGDGVCNFFFSVDLKGSSSLSFVPMGKETEVELDSSWPHPSFIGAYLPSQHKIGSDGFTARWKVSYFGRNFPQEFIQGNNPDECRLNSASFGVNMYVPVDFYQKCERAVKYGFLFISLTFLAFFLFELFNGLSIHPLQYLMVGFAMSIFYLLFLALSEHVGFLPSYATASAAVMAVITAYCGKVLKTKRRTGFMFGLLFGLYGFMYVLLENEDNALLLGSLGLFAILTAVMYLTRNVDWYRIRFGSAPVEAFSRAD